MPSLRGGIVLLDPTTSAIQRTIVLQYNPDTLSRTFQIQPAEGDHIETLRLKGPAAETIKVEAELDASDQDTPSDSGIYPQLAALETIASPTTVSMAQAAQLAQSGVLEIMPAISPLMLFIWSRNRVLPVKLTELSVTEEAFDGLLNPIRAKLTLSMKVLSSNDLEPGTRGYSLFMIYQQQKERLAATNGNMPLTVFGITGLP
jgi:hypothetical protein